MERITKIPANKDNDLKFMNGIISPEGTNQAQQQLLKRATDFNESTNNDESLEYFTE